MLKIQITRSHQGVICIFHKHPSDCGAPHSWSTALMEGRNTQCSHAHGQHSKHWSKMDLPEKHHPPAYLFPVKSYCRKNRRAGQRGECELSNKSHLFPQKAALHICRKASANIQPEPSSVTTRLHSFPQQLQLESVPGTSFSDKQSTELSGSWPHIWPFQLSQWPFQLY